MNSAPDLPGFIPPHGNYRELLSYQKAEVVYDLTYRFCQRFLSKGDRTIDQMVQAARSGKQNIAEGSKAAGTSKETEIKLTNVEELISQALFAHLPEFPFGNAVRSRAPGGIQKGQPARMSRTRRQAICIRRTRSRSRATMHGRISCPGSGSSSLSARRCGRRRNEALRRTPGDEPGKSDNRRP